MPVTRVLFICVHNAGRSQMAEGFFNALAQQRGIAARATSAGTLGAGQINPLAAQVMMEAGFPIDGQTPKQLTQEMSDSADRIVSMGCGVDADACPARFLVTEDWGLDDPAGRPLPEVRAIRDAIHLRVVELLDTLEKP